MVLEQEESLSFGPKLVLFSDCGRLSGPNQSLHGICLDAAEKCKEYHQVFCTAGTIVRNEMPMMPKIKHSVQSSELLIGKDAVEGSDLEIDTVRNS